MNQEQVKTSLLKLEEGLPDFSVVFSGKSSKKYDGLYKPDKMEIIIHNQNFKSDNELMYTAIHEFAHHVQFCRAAMKNFVRAHTIIFWDTFHKLLDRAEELGIYKNIFTDVKEFRDLTHQIKENFLKTNGSLMKEFGGLLIEAAQLCEKHRVSFEDYADRVLCLHRNEAKTIMKTWTFDISPEIGFDSMKTVARIKDPDKRQEVEKAFLEGKSPDMVRAEFMHNEKNSLDLEEKDKIKYLKEEKLKIQVTIKKLEKKLVSIDERINELQAGG